MAHGDAAQLAAVLGAVGVPLMLALRGRVALLGGLGVVAVAEALLAYALVPAEDLSRLWAGPLHVLALLFGIAALVALAVLFVRRPAFAPIALLAVAPFRVPLELGGQRAFLLLPLYAVLAAAVLALVWRTVHGEERAPLPLVLAVPITLFVGVTAVSLLWSHDIRAGTVQLFFF